MAKKGKRERRIYQISEIACTGAYILFGFFQISLGIYRFGRFPFLVVDR